MDKDEVKELSKQLYRAFGKIMNTDPASLPDQRLVDFLKRLTDSLGDASLVLECIAHSYIHENPEEYLNFMEEIYDIKKNEVYKV